MQRIFSVIAVTAMIATGSSVLAAAPGDHTCAEALDTQHWDLGTMGIIMAIGARANPKDPHAGTDWLEDFCRNHPDVKLGSILALFPER